MLFLYHLVWVFNETKAQLVAYEQSNHDGATFDVRVVTLDAKPLVPLVDERTALMAQIKYYQLDEQNNTKQGRE